jgi:hypothetical protein
LISARNKETKKKIFKQYRERGEEGDWKREPFPFLKFFFFLSWKHKLAYNEATINAQGGWWLGLLFPKS